MLSYAVTFLIIAIIAGVLGFGVIAGTAAMIAKVLFVLAPGVDGPRYMIGRGG